MLLIRSCNHQKCHSLDGDGLLFSVNFSFRHIQTCQHVMTWRTSHCNIIILWFNKHRIVSLACVVSTNMCFISLKDWRRSLKNSRSSPRTRDDMHIPFIALLVQLRSGRQSTPSWRLLATAPHRWTPTPAASPTSCHLTSTRLGRWPLPPSR